tara:strand:- start:310 stop:534 length:225 start_codon:yes stop_codon:yes gene_type:complete
MKVSRPKQGRERLNQFIKLQIPGFQIENKRKSPITRLLTKLLFFNINLVYVFKLPWKKDDPIIATSERMGFLLI